MQSNTHPSPEFLHLLLQFAQAVEHFRRLLQGNDLAPKRVLPAKPTCPITKQCRPMTTLWATCMFTVTIQNSGVRKLARI
jgi:hypothetical protein